MLLASCRISLRATRALRPVAAVRLLSTATQHIANIPEEDRNRSIKINIPGAKYTLPPTINVPNYPLPSKPGDVLLHPSGIKIAAASEEKVKIRYPKFFHFWIAAAVNSIKQAQQLNKALVVVPKTRFVLGFLRALLDEGFIYAYEPDPVHKETKVFLKYGPSSMPLLSKMRVVSTPGCRRYMKLHELAHVHKNQPGVTLIVSTPKGVLSSRRAIKERLGGEIVARIE